MKRSTLLLALPLLTSVVVGAMPAVASAQRPGCVTRLEYNHIRHRMPKERVHQIFDTRGMRISFYTVGAARFETRRYPACHHPRLTIVNVAYKNGHVLNKFAHWG
jgi:hypothetical protein